MLSSNNIFFISIFLDNMPTILCKINSVTFNFLFSELFCCCVLSVRSVGVCVCVCEREGVSVCVCVTAVTAEVYFRWSSTPAASVQVLRLCII